MIDDCIGVLRTYLYLKDKFRLESVSRQWQRKMYWSVGYLSIEADENVNDLCYVGGINGTHIPVNSDLLERIFLKFHNIECIEVRRSKSHRNLNDQLLCVISKKCELLSHLKLEYLPSRTKRNPG